MRGVLKLGLSGCFACRGGMEEEGGGLRLGNINTCEDERGS